MNLSLCRRARCVAILAIVVTLIGQSARAVGPDAEKLAAAQHKAINFLRDRQANDGSWTSANTAGVTALVVHALVASGVPVTDPTVARGLAAMEKLVQKDGGIYFPKTSHKNYETCVSLMTFKAANANGKYDTIIEHADKFLRGLQWDEGEGLESSDVRYGGAGYGGSKRPDLSNTQFLLDALKATGAKSDDPAIQKALVFVSRSQNLESQNNTQPFASKVNDGGFIYTPAAGGVSPAGKTDNGGLRSYGSMTYAGLKSMIYAGLTPTDPRVKAAFDWIRSHYSLTQNPGMGRNGLYYYYHTFAKTLSVLKLDEFDDADGHKHDWRKELADQILSEQEPNGDWVNGTARWLEGDPNLTTAYALLTLQYCKPTSATK
jgi:squalene-hopene/tetraprenyl-beta-curcumene cyclase